MRLPSPTLIGVGENDLVEDDDELFQTEEDDEFDDKGMPTAEHQRAWMDKYKENGVIDGSKKRQRTE